MRDGRVCFSNPLKIRKSLRRSRALVGLALLLASVVGGTAFAQSGAPTPKPKPPSAQPAQSEPGLPVLAHISSSPIPTLDEGTALRMAAAMLTCFCSSARNKSLNEIVSNPQRCSSLIFHSNWSTETEYG